MSKATVEKKLKCKCGCGAVLYVVNENDDMVTLGAEKDARKSFGNFSGVVVDKKELLKIIK